MSENEHDDRLVAIDQLAQRLYWNEQRLDPNPEAAPWAELGEDDRLLYQALVEDLLRYGELVQRARG